MPVVEGKTGKYCQIIFKIFLSFLFWKGHTRYSIWKLKKKYPRRFISLAHLFGKLSLRFLFSRIMALSLSHRNLLVSLEHRIPFWEPELWHLLGRKRFAFVDILGGTEITWDYFEKQSASMGQNHFILPSPDETIFFVSVLLARKVRHAVLSHFFCPDAWCLVT